MKLPKSLLQSILIGATVGTAFTACSTIVEETELTLHNENCEEDCKIDHARGNENDVDNNMYVCECPMCGMG